MRSNPANSSNILVVPLDEVFQSRPMNTKIYEPFLIARLMEHSARVENTLDYQVMLQDVGKAGTRTIPVRWRWSEEMIPATPLAAQPEDVTEAAAYGLAFAAVKFLTPAELDSVADRGERFDYVVAENGVLCGLEVSGTQTDDRQAMRERQQQKMRQLLDNSKRWGGYVMIVGFARRELWISRHEQGDGRR